MPRTHARKRLLFEARPGFISRKELIITRFLLPPAGLAVAIKVLRSAHDNCCRRKQSIQIRGAQSLLMMHE